MEAHRVFLWLNRINSVLFLLLLLAALGLTAFLALESNAWSQRRTVDVVKDDGHAPEREHFTLGSIQNICGYESKYVALQSERSGGGFSSGGSGGQIRNLVFFHSAESEARWLFDTNRYLIDRIHVIPSSYSGCKDAKASLIYYDVVKQDSDGDGVISDADKHSLAITDPNGDGYRELVTNATKVLDFEYDKEKRQINLLLQLGNNIVLRDYSIHGDLLAESRVTDLSGH